MNEEKFFLSELQTLVFSDKRLKASILVVYEFAKKAMCNLLEKYFTDHSILHLERILKIINLLLEQNRKSDLLSEYEKYTVVAGVLLHDIGMQDENSVEEAGARRDVHHRLSAQFIEREWKTIGLIEEFVPAVALIVEGHRGNIDERYQNVTIGTSNVLRSDLLSALLWLCDELDITYERIDINKRKFLKYDIDSNIHLFKHYYTQGLTIEDDLCLKIEFRYPKGRLEQYSEFFENIVLKKLQDVIKDVTPILIVKYSIYLVLRDEEIQRVENIALETIAPDLFENMVSEAMGIKHFLFINKMRFEELYGDINAELFYTGSVRWSDIVNSLDIERQQYNAIKGKLSMLYDRTCEKQCASCLLITGEGGSGKSTTLMRLAYDSVKDTYFSMATFFWYPADSIFNFKELRQFHLSSGRPLIVFLDCLNIDDVVDAMNNQMSLEDFQNVPIVFIFASRWNEWINARAGRLKFNFSEKELLSLLSDTEIEALLDKLDVHGQLHKLEIMEYSERVNVFKSKADRQLLVAMLEATRGIGFIEIIIQEYQNLKKGFEKAASAYEVICLFYYYEILIPQELLITLVQCADYYDFERTVLSHTHLIIIKQPSTKYGPQYRPRHREIAKELIENLSDYKTPYDKLRKVSIVLRLIETDDRPQRYVIINFLKNFILSITKTVRKADYHDRMEEVKQFIRHNWQKIEKFIRFATERKFIPELSLWGSIFRELRMFKENIYVLEKVLEINPYEKVANYRLATILSRTHVSNDDPEKIAKLYSNSYDSGNRDINFLYEYLDFCLKKELYSYVEKKIDSFEDFIAFSPEEKELKSRISAFLRYFKLTKERSQLASAFSQISQHIQATKGLKPADELAYIDAFEIKDTRKALCDYEDFLEKLKPNRPMEILLRLARTASKINGEEEKAIKFYNEIYNVYIKPNPQPYHFEIVYNYVVFATGVNQQTKDINYHLFKQCINLNSNDLRTYVAFAEYSFKQGDYPLCINVASDGLKIATMTYRYDSYLARTLKHIKSEAEERKSGT